MSALLAVGAAAAVVLCWPVPVSHRLARLGPHRPPTPGPVGTGLSVGLLALVLVAAAGASPVVACALPLGAATATRMVAARSARARRAARQEGCVEVVFALASELRAGRTPAQALTSAAGTTAALREPLEAAAAAVRAGAPAAPRLRAVAALPGCAALGGVAAAWQVTEQAGGAVADVLERLGRSLDEDATDRKNFEAALAGPRATMALLAALPALGVAMGQSAGAHPLHLLLHRPVGWALLAGAVVLEAVGLAWSRRIANGAMPS